MEKCTNRIIPRILPFVLRTVEKYGKNSFSWSGTTPSVVIWDLDAVKEVLQDKSGRIKKTPMNPLTRTLATGMILLQGDELSKRRKIINPAFRIEKLKEMVPAIVTSCRDMIKKWDELSGDGGSCTMDVWPEFDNLTGDVISRTAFGSTFEEGKKIFEMQKEQAMLLLQASLSPYFPGLRFIPTAKNRRRKLLDNETKSILRAIIDRKLKSTEQQQSDDLLALLLLQFSQDGLTIDDVIEECKLFYFAGQETTSTLLTWTLIMLSLHPTWQQKAREEVTRICGDSPDFESINQLRIVSMILYEVLRLYPAATSIIRRTYAECRLGQRVFPTGVDLVVPVLSLHHNPEYWGDDAEEFDPERFSDGMSRATKGRENAYYPFGSGQRTCPGQNLALVEAKTALAVILQRYSFDLSPLYVHAPCAVITLQPQHGAHLILHRLSRI